MAFQMVDMVRYAITGRWSNGRPVVNILDMSVRANPSAPGWPFTDEDRSSWVEEKALDVADNWAEHVVDQLTNTYTFEGVGWVDLNSANGTTGFVAPTGGPVVGGQAAASSPPQNTLLVSKIENGRRRGTRPGRWYVSGLPEGEVDGNGIVAGNHVTGMNTRFELFRQGVEDQGIADDVWSVPVVIHESTQSAGEITRFETSTKIGKQGRRYDGRA